MLQTRLYTAFVKNKTTKWNNKMHKHIEPKNKNKVTPSLPSHPDQQDYIKYVYLCKVSILKCYMSFRQKALTVCIVQAWCFWQG